MMYQNQMTTTAVQISTPMVVRIDKTIWDVGYQAVVTGTSTYNIEVSIDGTNFTPVVTGAAATTSGAITVPCRFIRLNATAGTGTVVLYVIEIQ